MRVYESMSGLPLQSGIKFHESVAAPRCELVRGVVTATYVYDDPSHPFASVGPEALFCDCLVYSSMPGSRVTPAINCMFLPSISGIQSGAIRKPRAAKGMVGGGTLDPQNPAMMDGDHVLIGFLDGRMTQPIILGFLPHPQADVGNEAQSVGHRQRLRLVDGDPSLVKHHGSFYGVTDSGDVVLDATQGNNGTLNQGRETAQGANVFLRAADGQQVKQSLVDGSGNETASVALTTGNVLTLGSGAGAAALASAVDKAFANLVANLSSAVLPVVTTGATTTASFAPGTLTPPSTVASNTLKIPN